MSCRVEILVEQYEDVLFVPIQAVTKVDGQSVVYVADGARSQIRPVETGLDNNRMVHVLSGLAAGEKILLNPPLTHRKPVDTTQPNNSGTN
jgi:HlyD family secretion protein